jgi:hypothetical protein
MAKTPSDKLFRLIHALSAAEKRYFRIFVRSRSDRPSKYLRLFTAIESLPALDEEALKTAVYRGAPVEGRKYSELKAYLYELILKSLQSFDEQQSVDYRLNFFLQSIQVLYKRGHYDDCREIVHKASKLSAQHERFAHQLELIRWEKQLAYTRMDVDYLHKYLEKLQLEEQQILLRLRNEADYRQLFFQVYTTIKREAQHRGEDRLQQLHTLLEHELFADADRALSHRARVLYYRTLNLYQYAALEYGAFYESGRKLIDLLESQPHFLRESLSDYIAALSNLILSCGLLQRYDEVRACLLRLRELRPLTEDDRRKIHRQYYTNMFVLCIFTGEFEEGRREMQRCQAEAGALDPEAYATASFYFQYCCICFGCNDFSGALHYLNAWLNQPRSVEREDLQSMARMLSLMLHYEMSNDVLLESLLRSATRFLQKKNRLFDLERRFMHLMNDLLRRPEPREQQRAFRAMKDELQVMAQLPGTRSLLQTFDLEAWLESKLTHQPFAEVVREKWLRTYAATPVEAGTD